jgi:hypothetical protein
MTKIEFTNKKMKMEWAHYSFFSAVVDFNDERSNVRYPVMGCGILP